LLPRVYGFELMMAPYAVAHMKLGWLLKETGYDFPGNERLRVYLTNTLEESEVVAGPLLALASQIAREANEAGKVKTQCPIMVIMGNPPYSGHSANKNQWSKDLIKNKLPGPNGAPGYFECDGKPLGERNPKWLNDDYVKFVRFGQRRIEQTGYGILGFITNHGYLDNPTFRGMRQSLMRTFDDIYILDLHGNANKKETAPDGSKDENVFDIMQGVSICIMVKCPPKAI
jgi:predicted helicase